MNRLYCPKELIKGEQIFINDRKQIHYLKDVLRLKLKSNIFVFDGQGNEYLCQIQWLSKKATRLLIKKRIKIKPKRKINLAIACALPKHKDRFDDLVDKLSQLGVDRIIPMITERVIVRWDYNQRQKHQQRWCKIAQQACAQSRRNALPIIEPIKEMDTVLSYGEFYDLKLIPVVFEKKRNLRDIISSALPKSALILIGPEGDFTTQELNRAKKSGFIPIFLGDLILRVETAAIAVAAFFRLYGQS